MFLFAKLQGVTYEQMKAVQMLMMTAVGGIGLTTGILLGKINVHFQKNCLLFASISVEAMKKSDAGQQVFVRSGSNWGSEGICNFVTFEGVLVFMYAFIWLWFYIHMDHTVAGQARNTMFVLPPMMINSLLCLCSIMRASYISEGYLTFCHNLCVYDSPDDHTCQKMADNCRRLQSSNWTLLQKSLRPLAYHDMMEASIALSWLEPVALGAHVLTIIVDIFFLTKAPTPTDINTVSSLNESPYNTVTPTNSSNPLGNNTPISDAGRSSPVDVDEDDVAKSLVQSDHLQKLSKGMLEAFPDEKLDNGTGTPRRRGAGSSNRSSVSWKKTPSVRSI